LVKESGRSSWVYLQNVLTTGAVKNQAVAVALALCEKYLQGRGAYRVHGGGFAGTVQAFVPMDMAECFRENVEKALGKGACHILSVRSQGGVEMQENC
jgi:galactokinase